LLRVVLLTLFLPPRYNLNAHIFSVPEDTQLGPDIAFELCLAFHPWTSQKFENSELDIGDDYIHECE